MGILQNALRATGKEICEKEKHFGECQVLEALPTQSTETILKLTVNVSVQTINQGNREAENIGNNVLNLIAMSHISNSTKIY